MNIKGNSIKKTKKMYFFYIFSCIFEKKIVFLQKVRYLTNEHNKKHKS